MDGVLVDSEPYHVQSFKVFMDELKLNYDESFIHSFIGHSIRSNIELINEKFMKDSDFDVDKAVEYRDKIYVDLIKQADLAPLQGIIELIDFCQKNKIRMGLASSSAREQVDVILNKLSVDGWNLYNIFQSIVTGDDVENRKPAPDIYNQTIKNINLPSHHCLAIEDSPAGVQSAKAAGLNCFALKSIFISPIELANADLLIDNVQQAMQVIEKKLDKK